MIANLLGNAVKYSPGGGLVAVEGEIADGMARVHVRDGGIGVPDEHQSRIFTKFFRGSARESGIAGTGLGLAVSREIIEAHGGRISFTSEAGAGSHFWFELPLDVEAESRGPRSPDRGRSFRQRRADAAARPSALRASAIKGIRLSSNRLAPTAAARKPAAIPANQAATSTRLWVRPMLDPSVL